MKACVYTRYGQPDVLESKDVPSPTPKENEVLVRVRAVGLNYADWALLRGRPFMVRLMPGGLSRPKYTILGQDIAGRVRAVGRAVRRFKPGDEVFADNSASGGGGLAEYAAVPENNLAPMPAGATFEQAAAAPMAAVVALQGLRDKGRVRAGQKVLIYGASGGVGTFAVQLAKAFGAEVTAVVSQRSLDVARALGAHRVIDYAREDFTRGSERYDLILAANGNRPLRDYQRALAPGGTYVATGGALAQIFQAGLLGPLVSLAGDKRMTNLAAQPSLPDLMCVKELMEAGQVTPVIDRRYPLSQAPEALRYLGEGHARGKVVVVVPETA
jgi:NADPH:quinone reductase-like Zn-dependent oxidoreductase